MHIALDAKRLALELLLGTSSEPIVLRHMGQFVRQQCGPMRSAQVELSRAEEDMPPERDRICAMAPRQPVGIEVGMDSHRTARLLQPFESRLPQVRGQLPVGMERRPGERKRQRRGTGRHGEGFRGQGGLRRASVRGFAVGLRRSASVVAAPPGPEWEIESADIRRRRWQVRLADVTRLSVLMRVARSHAGEVLRTEWPDAAHGFGAPAVEERDACEAGGGLDTSVCPRHRFGQRLPGRVERWMRAHPR
jgi:hypothetical protein